MLGPHMYRYRYVYSVVTLSHTVETDFDRLEHLGTSVEAKLTGSTFLERIRGILALHLRLRKLSFVWEDNRS